MQPIENFHDFVFDNLDQLGEDYYGDKLKQTDYADAISLDKDFLAFCRTIYQDACDASEAKAEALLN